MAESSTKWYPYPQEKPHYEGDYSVYLIDEGKYMNQYHCGFLNLIGFSQKLIWLLLLGRLHLNYARKQMTVKELIEELKAYPPDAEVMIPMSESPYYDFTNIVRSDEYYAMAVIIE